MHQSASAAAGLIRECSSNANGYIYSLDNTCKRKELLHQVLFPLSKIVMEKMNSWEHYNIILLLRIFLKKF